MLIEPVPIQVPITVKQIDIRKTVQRMLIIICELKLSSLPTSFDVSNSAGLKVNNTRIITDNHINGITVSVSAQTYM